MTRYIFKRIFYGLTVLWGVITVIFFLFNLLPGDPARLMLGNRPTQEAIDAINRDLGRDKPIFVQYTMYLNDLSPISYHQTGSEKEVFFLDEEKYEEYTSIIEIGSTSIILKYPYLRRSYKTDRKVAEVIKNAVPDTTVLAIASMGFAIILGICMGVVAAVNKGSAWDSNMLLVAVLGMALPSFFSGAIIQTLFAYNWGDFTGLPLTGSFFERDSIRGVDVINWKNLILPAFTLGIRPLTIVMQLTRNSLLDVLGQDYVRTAKAKGLGFFKVLFKHALRNALNPVITAISGWFAALLAGAIFVERIFHYKGLGYALFESVTNNDLPIAMGIVIFLAVIFVVVSILVDLIYVILDPRIRLN